VTVLHHRQHTDEQFLTAHAEVDALLQRLSRDITTLEDDDDAVNRQSLADAGERYETAEAQFGKAQSVGELMVVRSIVVEGIQSTRAVRTRKGLDPGSDPTPPPAPAPEAAQPHHSLLEGLGHSGGGLGSMLGAGAAGGLMGLIGGGLLGEIVGGDGGDGGDWGGGDGGGFGDG
jgi:hypothetical protein